MEGCRSSDVFSPTTPAQTICPSATAPFLSWCSQPSWRSWNLHVLTTWRTWVNCFTWNVKAHWFANQKSSKTNTPTLRQNEGVIRRLWKRCCKPELSRAENFDMLEMIFHAKNVISLSLSKQFEVLMYLMTTLPWLKRHQPHVAYLVGNLKSKTHGWSCLNIAQPLHILWMFNIAKHFHDRLSGLEHSGNYIWLTSKKRWFECSKEMSSEVPLHLPKWSVPRSLLPVSMTSEIPFQHSHPWGGVTPQYHIFFRNKTSHVPCILNISAISCSKRNWKSWIYSVHCHGLETLGKHGNPAAVEGQIQCILHYQWYIMDCRERERERCIYIY